MIPISEHTGLTDQIRIRRWLLRLLTCLGLLVVISSCTNSKLIISPLYNQLDDQMRKSFNKLGDFNDEQTAAFEASLGTYHVWHRQQELPQYAALMKDVATAIGESTADNNQVVDWFQRAEAHSLAARECHPVNFLFDLIKSLSDKQLDFIEQSFRQEQAKNLKRYESDTEQERKQRRLEKIEKWAGRIDLKITDEQRQLLRSAFARQQSLGKQYYALSAEWNKQFFNLARDQDAPQYDDLMRTHINSLWSLLEVNHPDKWRENRELWQEVAVEFEQSMTNNQRKQFSRWVTKMADTLISVSKDKPSFKVGDDPLVGCLVNEQESRKL